MIDIALLATSAWTLIQPYIPVLATKAAEEISKKVPEAVSTVWNAITKKFENKPAAKEVIQDVLKSPDDADTQAAFRQQLKKAMIEDEAFAVQLKNLLEAAGESYKATLSGDGAIAQGSGANAAGKGGVIISGNNTGNITSGSSSEPTGSGGGRPK